MTFIKNDCYMSKKVTKVARPQRHTSPVSHECHSVTRVTDKQIAAAIQPYILSATEGQDRGLMHNSKIYVLAKTNMPSCLVECLFMSNPEDIMKLMDEEYVKKMDEQIALGIEEAVTLLE